MGIVWAVESVGTIAVGAGTPVETTMSAPGAACVQVTDPELRTELAGSPICALGASHVWVVQPDAATRPP